MLHSTLGPLSFTQCRCASYEMSLQHFSQPCALRWLQFWNAPHSSPSCLFDNRWQHQLETRDSGANKSKCPTQEVQNRREPSPLLQIGGNGQRCRDSPRICHISLPRHYELPGGTQQLLWSQRTQLGLQLYWVVRPEKELTIRPCQGWY